MHVQLIYSVYKPTIIIKIRINDNDNRTVIPMHRSYIVCIKDNNNNNKHKNNANRAVLQVVIKIRIIIRSTIIATI